MNNLEKKLPNIVGNVLKQEDKVTQGLVSALLQEVMAHQIKSDIYPMIRKILDDEIDKSINAGFIGTEDFE